ncbi:hypothetical protein PVOR_16004 [Paenibacillus vortex V453]|uniref:Lipoprotein n=1 Tax=Paenibacillus vortex V453 TaxID=715225 RepID=A0A2R9SUX0_9BACL|nr:hypothetical protein [Paenibacillus vortex]EFU41142.1 hypothetical protein PVOR_16004 [Paenibacillus vortex V453]
MNKLSFLIIFAVFMILTTGCGGFYNSIEKDKVMVKKISNERESNEVNYEGVLSQEAVKTLSINAVNKYFNEQLTLNQVQFELMAADQNKLKELVEQNIASRASQKDREDAKTELNDIPDGLYYVTMTITPTRKKGYDIVLNARDGNVLKISNFQKSDYQTTVDINKNIPSSKITETSGKFIQDKEGYSLSDLSADFGSFSSADEAEIYYRSKKDNSLKYQITVNLTSMKVTGFNKDLMVMLKNYPRSPVNLQNQD